MDNGPFIDDVSVKNGDFQYFFGGDLAVSIFQPNPYTHMGVVLNALEGNLVEALLW